MLFLLLLLVLVPVLLLLLPQQMHTLTHYPQAHALSTR